MKKIIKKLSISFLPLLTAPLIAAKCFGNSIVTTNQNYTVERHTFVNAVKDYEHIGKEGIDTYYFNNDRIPYVSVKQALSALEGVVNTKLIKIGNAFNVLHNKNYQIYHANGASLKFNWENNVIEISDPRVFGILSGKKSIGIMHNLTPLSFKSTYINGKPQSIKFGLSKYNWKIHAVNKEPIIPLFVFNLLFLSQNYYNLRFNGSEYYGVDINTIIRTSPNALSELTNKFKINPETSAQRQDAFQSLRFVFDNFYGLAEEKKIDKVGFESWLDPSIKKDILNRDPLIYNKGYFKALHGQVNELHTSVRQFNYYTPLEYTDNNYIESLVKHSLDEYKNKVDPKFNSKWLNAGQLRTKLAALRERAIYHDDFESRRLLKVSQTINGLRLVEGNVPVVRFLPDNKSAVITLDSFSAAPLENLTNNPEENYIFDSLELMKYALDVIQRRSMETGKEINNIILDISQNGGGNVAALYKLIGLIKGKQDRKAYSYSFNTLTRTLEESVYRAEIPNKYLDKNYKWFLLTSNLSFSAANALVAYTAADKSSPSSRNVQIIGQRTGGGACAIIPIVLSDGTMIVVSSNTKIMTKSNDKHYVSVENGFEVPDKYKLDYEDFYNDDALAKLVSKK
ncbi:peptidase S41 [Mycoplasma bovis]|nr:peptidase S41 [Mycoplasmopsis bovis]MBT1378748.1 peptidase S41 [Mycoplasmopsis bovis]MBT1380909.1 peptidase S41 [Mycoplasmopsis bovis]MBT1386073.1 peptidase S41 [Mycoplasmopsis bovis]MBT1394690.1 peptidase S41 [Mycoplasmopsis bovis]